MNEPGERPLRSAPRVTSYNSHEEMLEDMRQREEESNAGVLPPQRNITWGSYFFKVANEFIPPLQILGHAYSEEELALLEHEAGASDREIEDILNVRRGAHERGYRWGMHYSKVVPEGELGSTHLVGCWPITREDFEFARDHDWQLSPEAVNRVMNEMEEAVRAAGGMLEGPSEG